jgi:hypothetical protein
VDKLMQGRSTYSFYIRRAGIQREFMNNTTMKTMHIRWAIYNSLCSCNAKCERPLSGILLPFANISNISSSCIPSSSRPHAPSATFLVHDHACHRGGVLMRWGAKLFHSIRTSTSNNVYNHFLTNCQCHIL